MCETWINPYNRDFITNNMGGRGEKEQTKFKHNAQQKQAVEHKGTHIN